MNCHCSVTEHLLASTSLRRIIHIHRAVACLEDLRSTSLLLTMSTPPSKKEKNTQFDDQAARSASTADVAGVGRET